MLTVFERKWNKGAAIVLTSVLFGIIHIIGQKMGLKDFLIMTLSASLIGAILDAVDEGLLDREPTRKVIIKGKVPSPKKIKYINQFELYSLLVQLDLKSKITWEWFIMLVAKTGLRFSEALALTPQDFDFAH